ncbi:MAG TPA: hypothetical protein VFE82_08480 [Ramlibacter sp.]|jgi:hypothetical protein|uniref:N-acyl amino acid synthase FeeM domain-containing protein n=1 Tax=Ramlibacter sp. TaxID=1917967 RepID=UPI002D3EDE7A|nr:hypothetical protein [Ramlibacter sp.]HZY18504.1 hypothetical protein [Ramlibacter sp.]
MTHDVTVRTARSAQDRDAVFELRRIAYARHPWSEQGRKMAYQSLDDAPWVRSLLALHHGRPAGTLRLIASTGATLDRLECFETWEEELRAAVPDAQATVLEFNRFAVHDEGAAGVPVVVQAALLKAALAVVISEKMDLCVAEITQPHLRFYQRQLRMTASVHGKHGRITGETYHLVTGRLAEGAAALQASSPWLVPDAGELATWEKTSELVLG